MVEILEPEKTDINEKEQAGDSVVGRVATDGYGEPLTEAERRFIGEAYSEYPTRPLAGGSGIKPVVELEGSGFTMQAIEQEECET